MNATPRVLVVDDEDGIRFALRDFLESSGFSVEEAGSCAEAEKVFRASRPDAALLDFRLPDGNALDLIPKLKAQDSTVPVIVLTAHASIDLAVRAIQEGAEQFLTKPVELPSLLVILQRALENQRIRRKEAAKARGERPAEDPFLGESAAIRSLADQAQRALSTESPILVLGETGSGKGVLARWLHRNGTRPDEAFVDLNCAGLSREFLESELFGHEKGAFTGAVSSKPGLFEVAHRGTMFLDEIGDVDLQVQPKLLKVLEEKSFRRLGEVRDRHVDVRLIAATHHDLNALIREQKFRSDLYYRVSTIPLTVPPLRSRVEDIPVIARHFLSSLQGASGPVALAPDAEKVFCRYPWPGNLRELRNVIERALLFVEGNTLSARELHFESSPDPSQAGNDLQMTLQDVEVRHLRLVLEDERGHVEKAASRLGVPKSSLYEKIRRYGIVVSKV
ncbi:MAG: sigma-54-dependent transcriptional regulator [Thermoanaerobaculia bacterium]